MCRGSCASENLTAAASARASSMSSTTRARTTPERSASRLLPSRRCTRCSPPLPIQVEIGRPTRNALRRDLGLPARPLSGFDLHQIPPGSTTTPSFGPTPAIPRSSGLRRKGRLERLRSRIGVVRSCCSPRPVRHTLGRRAHVDGTRPYVGERIRGQTACGAARARCSNRAQGEPFGLVWPRRWPSARGRCARQVGVP